MLPSQEFIHGDLIYGDPNLFLPVDQSAELPARRFWQRPDVPFFLPAEVSDVEILARVEHGRWLVDCPFCASAQFACRDDPRFFCVACLNEQAGALWIRVLWPPDPQAIEDVLRSRLTVNANWHPSESVADLVAENVEHEMGT